MPSIEDDDYEDNLNKDMEDFLSVWIEDKANSLNTSYSNKVSRDKEK